MTANYDELPPPVNPSSRYGFKLHPERWIVLGVAILLNFANSMVGFENFGAQLGHWDQNYDVGFSLREGVLDSRDSDVCVEWFRITDFVATSMNVLRLEFWVSKNGCSKYHPESADASILLSRLHAPPRMFLRAPLRNHRSKHGELFEFRPLTSQNLIFWLKTYQFFSWLLNYHS